MKIEKTSDLFPSHHAAARHPETMKSRTGFWTDGQMYGLFSEQPEA
jgi:hypothetical protein